MTDAPANALTCPSCGAPAASGAARCEYCHAILATASCPFCFKLLFEGSAFCPHCGTARSRSAALDQRTSPCPACRGAMRWIKIGETDLLECEACDGTWLESSAFERLCADRERQAAVVHTDVSGRTLASRAPAEKVRYRPCPRCGKLMNRMNFGRLSGTIVDICRGHGTFLDRGELHQVVQFILDGGMALAKKREHEAHVEEQLWNNSTLERFLAALLDRH